MDECIGDHGCDMMAECINTDGSFDCVCLPGFQGDGVNCNGKPFTKYELVFSEQGSIPFQFLFLKKISP